MVNIKDFLLYIIATLLLRALETKDTNSPSRRCLQFRLRIVLHFSSGIVERAKRERNASERENHPMRGVIFTRARSTIAEEKWGTTCRLSAIKPNNKER